MRSSSAALALGATVAALVIATTTTLLVRDHLAAVRVAPDEKAKLEELEGLRLRDAGDQLDGAAEG